MKIALLAGVVAVMGMSGFSGPVVDADGLRHCTFERDVDLTVGGNDVASLYIDAGAGDLEVEGRADVEAISVQGRICASHEDFLEVLDVTTDRSGDAVSVRTHYPPDSERGSGSWSQRTASIDLVVLVPLGTVIEIEDSSGEVTLSGTGSLTIDDSSGKLDIRDVDGDVAIEDGSGGIEIHGVRGGVLLRDGSGGIDISDVGEDVRIVSDGSGSISVEGVGGDFVVGSDGSGSIRHGAVEGRVEVPQRRRKGRGGRG